MTMRRPELAGEVASGGEVIGVGVAVDHVADAEPLLHGEGDVAVDQVERGIDDHSGARLLAADDVGQAAAGPELLEEHGRDGGRGMPPRQGGCARKVASRRWGLPPRSTGCMRRDKGGVPCEPQ